MGLVGLLLLTTRQEDAIINPISIYPIFPMQTTTSRPFGVTLVAYLYVIMAILALMAAARYIFTPGGSNEMILLFTRLRLPVTFINLLAVPPLITAGLATLLFRGLWQGRLWGWTATLFFSFLGMLASLGMLAFFLAFYFNTPLTTGSALLAFLLFAAIFIYFLKTPIPPSSTVSQSPPAAPAAAAPELLPIQPAQPRSIPPAPLAPSRPLASNPSLQYATIHSAPTVALNPVTESEAVAQPSPPPLACLTVISGPDQGHRFEIFRDEIIIGRHPTQADILLSDPTVSALHARLRRSGGTFWVMDLGSTNGTFVNNHRVQDQPLAEGDLVRFGASILQFSQSCSNHGHGNADRMDEHG